MILNFYTWIQVHKNFTYYYNYTFISFNLFNLDSFMYQIKTYDFYDDIIVKRGFMDKLDTSNMPSSHQCYSTARKKVPGTFTDESGGVTITEVVALRAKSYAFKMGAKETLKAKGVGKYTVKNHMTIDDYKQCLFFDNDNITNDYSAYRDTVSFRSYKHQVKTISTHKLALNRYDDKRFVMQDQVHTLAHGHYMIK